MQRPIAVPRIPASASGVSTQRFSPKRSRRPAVARKTPPARPTSSPITITSSSRASSTWKPSLIASTIRSSAIAEPRRRFDVGVLEEQFRIRVRLRLGGGDPGAHDLGRLGLDRRVQIVVEDPLPSQVALVPAETFVLLL